MRTIATLSWLLPVGCLLFGIQSCKREFEPPTRWIEPSQSISAAEKPTKIVLPVATPTPLPVEDPQPVHIPNLKTLLAQGQRELDELLAVGAKQLVLLIENFDYMIAEVKEAMPLLDPPKYDVVSLRFPAFSQQEEAQIKPDRPPIVEEARLFDKQEPPTKKVQIVQLEQQPEPATIKLDNSTNEIRTIEVNGTPYKVPAKSHKIVVVTSGEFTYKVIDFDEVAKTRTITAGKIYEITIVPAGVPQTQAQLPMPKIEPRITQPTPTYYYYPSYSYPYYAPIYYGGYYGGCSR